MELRLPEIDVSIERQIADTQADTEELTAAGTIGGVPISGGSAGAPTSASYVTIGTDATLTAERVLTGTANQITATDNGAGSTVVLSTPQDLHTGATPRFTRLGLGAAADASIELLMSGTAPSLKLLDTTASAKSLTVAVDANVANFRESAGASGSLLTLDLTNNRVGIGTSAPGYPLDIRGTVASISLGAGAFFDGRDAEVALFEVGSGAYFITAVGWKTRVGATSAAIMSIHNGAVNFYTDASLASDTVYSPTARFHISTVGKVGIGTTTPDYLLDLEGSTTADADPLMRVINTRNAGVVSNGTFECLVPNLAAGANAYFALGKVASNNNRAALVYAHVGDGSTSNRLSIGFFGAGDLLNINASGNVGIGTTTFGTSAAKVLALFNGTVPTTSPADTVQLFSVDLSAGNATLGIRTETAVVTESVVSDRTLSVKINGTTYKICLKV